MSYNSAFPKYISKRFNIIYSYVKVNILFKSYSIFFNKKLN